MQNAFKAHRIEKLTKCKMQYVRILGQPRIPSIAQALSGPELRRARVDSFARRKEAPMENPVTPAPVAAASRAHVFCRYRAMPETVCDARIRRAQTRSRSPTWRRCRRCLDGLEKQRARLLFRCV
ncbi:hypothetical protein EXIGLDRAFT_474805 [Exidia glandulosa HHB12029]|uniref:Uncharacterized protein n=1 Tax=Exidia glandulosa HHB12029 TaxID=1314781 RepID=A0A165JWE5_EXIGL|nr:hypothetical protein EXIGLDRAFT_474805 [Exidia glandulosa HHB12029]